MLNHSFSKEIFPNIQPAPLLDHPEAIPPCPLDFLSSCMPETQGTTSCNHWQSFHPLMSSAQQPQNTPGNSIHMMEYFLFQQKGDKRWPVPHNPILLFHIKILLDSLLLMINLIIFQLIWEDQQLILHYHNYFFNASQSKLP